MTGPAASLDGAVVVAVDPRLGAALPAAAVRTVAAAAQVRLDPSLPAPVADAFARDLGAVAAPGTPVDGPVVVLTAADETGGGLPGAALLDAVRVMDVLRSPGGCPWDAAQTHASLLRYLVEETYELYDAVVDGDRAAMREELGDVLLQVLFHARVAAEGPDGFGIDDVAADLVEKLVGRHPHVFSDAERITDADDQQVRWEQLKATEKRRDSALDGVARAQPAAALAAKYLSRARKAGVPGDLVGVAGQGAGAALWSMVAGGAEDDPEGALRAAAEEFAAHVRAAEHAARAAGDDPHALDADGWRRYWPTPA